MLRNPDLAVVPAGESGDGVDDDEEEDRVATTEELEESSEENDEAEEEEEEEAQDGVQHEVVRGSSLNPSSIVEKVGSELSGANWVMQRLRGIGADSRGNRRIHVMKVFCWNVCVFCDY
jgi:ribosomal protein S25